MNWQEVVSIICHTLESVYKGHSRYVPESGGLFSLKLNCISVVLCTLEPVYKDHPRDWEKVVSAVCRTLKPVHKDHLETGESWCMHPVIH